MQRFRQLPPKTIISVLCGTIVIVVVALIVIKMVKKPEDSIPANAASTDETNAFDSNGESNENDDTEEQSGSGGSTNEQSGSGGSNGEDLGTMDPDPNGNGVDECNWQCKTDIYYSGEFDTVTISAIQSTITFPSVEHNIRPKRTKVILLNQQNLTANNINPELFYKPKLEGNVTWPGQTMDFDLYRFTLLKNSSDPSCDATLDRLTAPQYIRFNNGTNTLDNVYLPKVLGRDIINSGIVLCVFKKNQRSGAQNNYLERLTLENLKITFEAMAPQIVNKPTGPLKLFSSIG